MIEGATSGRCSFHNLLFPAAFAAAQRRRAASAIAFRAAGLNVRLPEHVELFFGGTGWQEVFGWDVRVAAHRFRCASTKSVVLRHPDHVVLATTANKCRISSSISSGRLTVSAISRRNSSP